MTESWQRLRAGKDFTRWDSWWAWQKSGTRWTENWKEECSCQENGADVSVREHIGVVLVLCACANNGEP